MKATAAGLTLPGAPSAAPLVREPSAQGTPATLAVLAVRALPFGLFVAHAVLFWRWLIDDAGISFAYARNLALGHGLVAQPGAAPVEGFSNPLWTLLIAGTYALRLFDLAWTPKLLSLALVAATFWLIDLDLGRRSAAPWSAAFAAALLASSTSFVVWTTSGLENPLLACLAALSCLATGLALEGGPARAAGAGAVAGLLALTRPDALVYAAALPLAALLSPGTWSDLERAARRLAAHAAGFAAVFVPYLLFRRLYFGAWLPNTYYAKDHPSLGFLFDRDKWTGLLEGALGPVGLPGLVLVILGIGWLAARRALGPRSLSLALHLALATAAYMLMPEDWMGEFRFATPFLIFFYWSLAEALQRLGTPAGGAWRSGLAAAAGLCVLATSVAVHAPRTAEFAAGPVVPLSGVARYYGDGFNALADALGVRRASLLAPDMGGTLLTSRLAVYDLVGLCDREAARTLRSDSTAFHRYVLEGIRPTFIHIHGAWSGWAGLHADPRFVAAYAPIREDWPAGPHTDDEPTWGDYVRRDLLGPDPGAMLNRLRVAYAQAGMETHSF
jgi:hypothetical protein